MEIPVRVSSMDQIDLFENDLYSIGLCAKKETKTNKKQLHINVNWTYNECDSLTFVLK